MTSLQDLPGNAVTLIIRKLPSADRRRLSLCCQRLRRLCADLTGVVAVTQQVVAYTLAADSTSAALMTTLEAQRAC
jgi:hypothetical protein